MQWVKDLPSKLAGSESPADADGVRADVSVLMLAGDVASDLSTLEEGLQVLKSKFDEVVFVPGNHELWCQRGGGLDNAPDSMIKLEDVMRVCRQTGVHTEPVIIQLPKPLRGVDGEDSGAERHREDESGQAGGAGSEEQGGPRVFLLPFLSWYHADFDKESELPAAALEEVRIEGMRPFEVSD